MDYLITMTRDAKQSITTEVTADSLDDAIAAALEKNEMLICSARTETVEGKGEWEITGRRGRRPKLRISRTHANDAPLSA